MVCPDRTRQARAIEIKPFGIVAVVAARMGVAFERVDVSNRCEARIVETDHRVVGVGVAECIAVREADELSVAGLAGSLSLKLARSSVVLTAMDVEDPVGSFIGLPAHQAANRPIVHVVHQAVHRRRPRSGIVGKIRKTYPAWSPSGPTQSCGIDAGGKRLEREHRIRIETAARRSVGVGVRRHRCAVLGAGSGRGGVVFAMNSVVKVGCRIQAGWWRGRWSAVLPTRVAAAVERGPVALTKDPRDSDRQHLA